jgi:ATP-dependent RNA helicase DHX37/DHR1
LCPSQLAGAPSRAIRYRAALSDGGHVFLHPTSALHAGAPEWVVYTELLQSGARPYMMGTTAVEPSWLPDAAPRLVTLTPPLTDPPPRYVGGGGEDAVVAWHGAAFGPQSWPLPHVPRRMRAAGPHAEEAVAHFAAALLGGRVSAGFSDALQARLAAVPATAARPEARAQRRVGELLHALRRRSVASRASLAAAWRAEPKFLLPELSAWMRAGQAHVLERAWPAIVACAPPRGGGGE